MSKRGYFFTLDGMLALGIIIVGFIILYAYFVSTPPEIQAEFFASDLLDFLDKTQIKDLDNTIVPPADQGSENTILEQIAIYCNKGVAGYNNAKLLASSTTLNGALIRNQYGFELLLKDANRIDKCGKIISRGNIITDHPKLIITSKEIVYFKDGNSLIGPWIAEVNVWN